MEAQGALVLQDDQPPQNEATYLALCHSTLLPLHFRLLYGWNLRPELHVQGELR